VISNNQRQAVIRQVYANLTIVDQNSRAISLAAGIYKPKREVGGNFIDHDDRSNTEISALSTKPTVRDIAHPRFTPGFSKIVEIPSKVSKSTTSTRTPISILNQTSNQQKDGAASDFIDPKEIRLGVSSVPMEMQGDINTFKLKFSMKNLRTYGAMTHLVVLPETDKQTKDKFVGRTFKVMMAIVHGIPIVEYRWVRDSVLSDRILDPSSYLVLRDRVSDKGIARSRGEVPFGESRASRISSMG
jgi:hypothetical protein